MYAPLSWLREFVAIPKNIKPKEIADVFVKLGFEVEAINETGSELKGPIVVGKVISIKELTEHKKPIRYVELDCGEKSTRFVICGARNFSVGDLVIVSKPGAVLPGNFVISSGLNLNLNFPPRNANRDVDGTDESLNGKYIILAARHMIKPNKHETVLEVATDSTNRPLYNTGGSINTSRNS